MKESKEESWTSVGIEIILARQSYVYYAVS
jgi:hypothetical protein